MRVPGIKLRVPIIKLRVANVKLRFPDMKLRDPAIKLLLRNKSPSCRYKIPGSGPILRIEYKYPRFGSQTPGSVPKTRVPNSGFRFSISGVRIENPGFRV